MNVIIVIRSKSINVMYIFACCCLNISVSCFFVCCFLCVFVCVTLAGIETAERRQ